MFKCLLIWLVIDSTGSCKLKFEEQCGVVFNLACAAALLNQEAYALEALTLLVNVDGISLSDLTGDPDLKNFRTQEWFVSFAKMQSLMS